MTVKHQTVSVGTSPTSLTSDVPDRIGVGGGLTPTRSIAVTNTAAASVLLGGSDVTASVYGYELKPGGQIVFDLTETDELFAVAASGTATVRVLHLGV